MTFSRKPSCDAGHTQYLFAYGTLQPGHAPAELVLLVRFLEFVGKGSVRGTLYHLGRYPGAVLDPAAPRLINGTVFALPDDEDFLGKLDAYEDYDPDAPDATSLFTRRTCAVRLTDGRSLQCWIYEYNGSVDEASIVESGTFER